jgi:CDP-glucose 4,6-dehydratase
VESLVSAFAWRGRRVFITGHTGFKGSWLSLWLADLGAEVTGFSLPAPTTPSLFEGARLAELVNHVEGDVRDAAAVTAAVRAARPEIVFHLAAQPLVRASYDMPVETYATNVMGTVHLLDACRGLDALRAVVCVTSDKCYENREWTWPYRETDAIGGFDPYSSSKGAAELVVAAYRRSYFTGDGAPLIASVRAGNVIGGGDWAADRLVPDILTAFHQHQPVVIRNPHSTRPWQHVLEPLSGYLTLAERLFDSYGHTVAEGWNFGPREEDARPVQWIVERLAKAWGEGAGWQMDSTNHPHEAGYLKLDISKARSRLDWQPSWDLDTALAKIVEWQHAWLAGENARGLCLAQIAQYTDSMNRISA